MNRERSLLVLILLSCSLATACSAVTMDLTSDFPQWTNGENNIFLQYREDGEYYDLKPMSYVVFAHPESSSTVPHAGPVISRGTRANLSPESYTHPDRIYIRPAMEKDSGTDTAGVIRIIPPLSEGFVKITGEAGMEGILVPMAIYHGEANYDKPLWSSTIPGRFEVNFSFTGTEPVFLSASAPSNDMKFKGYWKGVMLSFTETPQGTPPESVPSTLQKVTTTGTPVPQKDTFPQYLQAFAVIVAALIGSFTTIWVTKHKKE